MLGGKPQFRVLGIPVRISAGFWFMAVLLGTSSASPNWKDTLMWVLIVFISVGIHELGHAMLARAFGASPAILLYALGGRTVNVGRFSRFRTALVSMAGPAAGFVLALLAVVLMHTGVARDPTVAVVLQKTQRVNLAWGIINLIPVLPFDGGLILAAILGPRRLLASATVSAVVGAAIATYGMMQGFIFPAVLFGMASLNAVGQIRAALAHRSDLRDGLDARLQEGKRALEADDTSHASACALEVVEKARTDVTRNAALWLLAWVHVAQGDGRRAREALAGMSRNATLDPFTLAAVEDAAGNRTGAVQILELARAQGLRQASMSKLLIDLYARAGDLARAAQLAAEDVIVLGPAQARRVLTALLESAEYRSAAALASRLFSAFGSVDDAVEGARALSQAGDTDGALSALEAAVALLRRDASGTGRIAALALDPAFGAISGLERFRRIVEVHSLVES